MQTSARKRLVSQLTYFHFPKSPIALCDKHSNINERVTDIFRRIIIKIIEFKWKYIRYKGRKKLPVRCLYICLYTLMKLTHRKMLNTIGLHNLKSYIMILLKRKKKS